MTDARDVPRGSSAGPLRLSELSWTEASEHFRRDPRLLVPVGTLLQHGPHLPLNTDTLIVTRLAERLSEEHGVALAPTLPYGVGSETEQAYAGSSCVRGKTLHRMLNELVENWEGQGVEEIYLLTAHGFGPHLQAIGTVVSGRSRIRAVDLHAVDLQAFLDAPHAEEHAGELETSLLLHLAPDLVRKDRVRDMPVEEEALRKLLVGEEPVPLPGSDGVVGCPSRASAAKGREIFEFLVQFLGDRVLRNGGDEHAE
jgi:creatinine amidohydrolase